MVALEILNLDTSASLLESQKSTDLVVAVIYAAISDACYSRKLLSSDYFQDLWIQGDVSPSKVVRLDHDRDAPELVRDLKAWHEAIKAAISHGYVQRITFGFTSDASIRTVLEEYVFDVQYTGSCNRHPYSANVPQAKSVRAQTAEILDPLDFFSKQWTMLPKRPAICVYEAVSQLVQSNKLQAQGICSSRTDTSIVFQYDSLSNETWGAEYKPSSDYDGYLLVLDSIDVQRGHIHQTGDDLSMPTSHATSTDRNQNITISNSHPVAGATTKARPREPMMMPSDAPQDNLYWRTPDSVRKRMERASMQGVPPHKRMKSSASVESSGTLRRGRRGGRLAGMQKLLQ
eukprot:jgi/Picre1/35218/NNA_002680.t1